MRTKIVAPKDRALLVRLRLTVAACDQVICARGGGRGSLGACMIVVELALTRHITQEHASRFRIDRRALLIKPAAALSGVAATKAARIARQQRTCVEDMVANVLTHGQCRPHLRADCA
eukprot:6514597-Prymnesium_polylepis.1